MRILGGRTRAVALLAGLPVALVTVFSGWYLLMPIVSGIGFSGVRRHTRRRSTAATVA